MEKQLIIHRDPETGFIRKDDWWKLVDASRTIGNCFFTNPHGGVSIDGQSYEPLDIIEEPDDILAALNILNQYFQPKEKTR